MKFHERAEKASVSPQRARRKWQKIGPSTNFPENQTIGIER